MPEIYFARAANGPVGLRCVTSVPWGTLRFGVHPTANENNVTEDDVLAFIANSIGSVWALELLLLLKRDAGRGWDADSLVRELRGSPIVIDEALQRLRAAGLVIQVDAGTYRYRPASPQLDGIASKLEGVYAARPIAVIKAIVAARTQ